MPEKLTSSDKSSRIWFACVRINSHDKVYLQRQLAAFRKSTPLLISWEDGRDSHHISSHPGHILKTPWQRKLPIKGGNFIARKSLRLRALWDQNPLAANSDEQHALASLAKETSPCLIYAHTGFVGLRLLPVAQKLGVPLVVHFHGLDITETEPVYQQQIAAKLHQFDHVIVVGKWMARWFTDRGYAEERISVIPMGAPVATPSTPNPSRENSHCRFAAVGRLVGVKGLDRTLRAFTKVKEALPNSTLSIIGSGPLEQDLRELATNLGLNADTIFLGALPSEQVMSHLETKADVLVQHSLDNPGGPEAFGVTITEGMAKALPVVSTLSGGIPDQVIDGETGFLVEQNDVDAMANRMCQLAKDPVLRQKMGLAGQRRAQERFDATLLAHRCEDLLQQIANAPNR